MISRVVQLFFFVSVNFRFDSNLMRFSPIVRFLSSNGFYVHIKNKTPNWQPLLSEGEKIIGYPSSLQSLVNLKYLFNEEVSTLVGYLRKLVGTQHPLLKLASNMFESPPKAAHARSVLLLLISKAAGIPKKVFSEEHVKHGIHEHQRQLAELIEMSRRRRISSVLIVYLLIFSFQSSSWHFGSSWFVT